MLARVERTMPESAGDGHALATAAAAAAASAAAASTAAVTCAAASCRVPNDGG